MIYDCFTYFNEEDLLEIRLETLNLVVDKFVITEGNKTFSGLEKPLTLKSLPIYEKFKDRIIYIPVDMPKEGSAWDREFFQRKKLSEGLIGCSPTDIIMLSDVDEIPKPEIVRILPSLQLSDASFEMDLMYFYLNTKNKSRTWSLAGATTYAAFISSFKNDFQFFRNHRNKTAGYSFSNAGWHFSYLTDIVTKLGAFAHQEYNNPSYHAKVTNAKETLSDPYGHTKGFDNYLRVEELPAYIQLNLKKYQEKGFIKEKPIKILIMILSADVQGYDKLIEGLRNTWGAIQHPQITKLYYYGIRNEPILGKVQRNGDVLVCNVPESIPSINRKNEYAFEHVLENYDFDYLVRPCCGSYIQQNYLYDMIFKKPRKEYYGGFIGYLGDVTFASGALTVLSRDLVQELVDNPDSFYCDSHDDVAIGKYLTEKGYQIDPLARYDYELGKDNIYKKAHHYHFCHSVDSMYKVHDLLKKV